MLMKRRQGLPAAFVLGLYDTGLSAVRGLGRKGVPVVAFDYETGNAGFASRYCRAVRCQHPEHAPEELVALLISEARSVAGPAMLLAASDAFVLFVSRYREPLREYFRFTLPPAAVLEALVDKRLQYELAGQIGIPHPATFYPETAADVGRIASQLDYPAVIKPYVGHRYREEVSSDKGLTVDGPEALHSTFERLFETGAQALVQSFAPGPITNLINVTYCLDQAGNLLDSFMLRKLRQFPVDLGVGTFVECYFDAAAFELGLKFCRALGYRGIAEVEFKLDERTGRFALIELNPRIGAQNQLALSCGHNLPWMAYADLFDLPADAPHACQANLRWLDFKGDYLAFKAMREAGSLRYTTWLRSLLTARSFATFALDDPGPFFKRHNYGLDYARALCDEFGALLGHA